MKKFYLTNSFVRIHLEDGRIQVIYFNQDSGKVYYRLKIDTISEVKHTGIYLGTDDYGTHYFIHNHYHVGRPCVVTAKDFSKGHQIHEYSHTSLNDSLTVIQKGLEEVIRGETYHSVSYNCQTLINLACNNKRQSEDVDKWVGRLVFAGLIALGVAAFSGGGRR